MRSAWLCILAALMIVQIGGSQVEGDDFRPTPIPLDTWHEKREGRVGTLQEAVGTDSPLSVAVVPAHYWEDALRHSVYLTLVRDKIDQLIAKGEVKSSESKLVHAAKEVDDYDLWEKIKSAPFDRLSNEEPTSFGDITIMARGRLIENNGAFRFAEDDTMKETCKQEKCSEGVQAFWSVKRVRQRDVETSPGRYHYELIFSVTSQTPKVQRTPYGNSVRTFTVRESQPQEQKRIYEPINHPKRPQRAIWFHKNIAPTPYHTGRNYYNQGLDRIFSSLFSDEDVFEEPRYKPNPYVPHAFSPYSKIGYIGSQNEQYQQKPTQYKPQSFRFSRPPLSAPPLSPFQPYTDFDGMINNPSYPSPHGDYRYMPSNIVKTTRPAVLPTPVMPAVPPLSNIKNLTIETTSTKFNLTENTTKDPEIGLNNKKYNKPKPTPMKINYFSDHVRPPVYSTPPGVFVTMDKKPFKPMPPLKLIHSSRPIKSKPIDFRPSPQVLDVQFSDPEPSPDSAFRPITINYSDNNTTEKSSIAETNKKRKLTPSEKKPEKKHENTKLRVTTLMPDIITANSGSFEDTDTMEWANLIGAFTKTTPMAAQKEKANVTESITSVSPTTISTPTVTEAERKTTTTTTTTMKPKKRTRPPPKFRKQEKIKKHKRITTTTQSPEKTTVGKQPDDLIPQASSAATKPSWKPKNKTLSTTPMSTSTSTVSTTSSPSTTTSQSTTTSRTTTTTNKVEPITETLQTKRNNRYRQSTLILKGTSVKHDRWSTTSLEKYKSNLSSKYPPRRKGSNFQGYLSSTPKTVDTERNKEDHQDHATTPFVNTSSTIESITESNRQNTSQTTELDREETEIEYDSNSDLSSDDMHLEEQDDDADTDTEDPPEENEEQESKDHNEFIFEITTTLSEEENKNEQDHVTTDRIITTPPDSPVKNKGKCKKKKQNNLTTTEENNLLNHIDNDVPTTLNPSTLTPEIITPDFFDELLGGFTLDASPQETKTSQSTAKPEFKDRESGNNGHFVQIDDDFEDFLDSLERKQNHDENSEEYEEDDTDISEEDSPFNNEEENREARNSDDDYNDYQDRQYSLLELMAME